MDTSSHVPVCTFSLNHMQRRDKSVFLNGGIYYYKFKFVMAGRLGCPFKCAEDPLNRLCQMKASLSKSSISFSVHSLVGRLCRNIMIS